MAINLKKLCRDVGNPDEEIRVLALTTVCQLTTTSVEDPADLVTLKDALAVSARSESQDTVFLARKALNKVGELMARMPMAGAAGGPVGGQEPEAAPQAGLPSREDVLAELAVAEDPVQLATGLARLGRVGEPVDFELAIPLLKHADARVRANAIELVERIDDSRRVTELLTPLMADQNNRVRGNVAKALGRIGFPRIVKFLEAMMRSPRLAMRESAVYAISHIRGAAMVELLILALRDPYEGIRLRAVKGLKVHNDERALPHIRPLLNDLDIDVCEEARKAIRVIRKDQAPTVAGELFDIEILAARDAEKRAAEAAAAPAAGDEAPSVDASSALGGTATSKLKAAELLQKQAESLLAKRPSGPALNLDGRTRSELEKLLEAECKRVGLVIFKRVRSNELSHPALSMLYYDILKCQETLKRHQERAKQEQKQQDRSFFGNLKLKLGGKQDDDPVTRLERRIDETHVQLGRKAVELGRAGQLELGDEEDVDRVNAVEMRLAETPAGS